MRGFRFSSEVCLNTYVLIAMVVLALITIYLTYNNNSVSSFRKSGTYSVTVVNKSQKTITINTSDAPMSFKSVSTNNSLTFPVNARDKVKIKELSGGTATPFTITKNTTITYDANKQFISS